MVTSTHAMRRLRLPIALIALLALWSALTPAAVAEDEDETGVVCESELIVEKSDDDEEETYWFRPGDEVECVAFGVDPEEDVSWHVHLSWEVWEAPDDLEELTLGEEGLAAEEDGTLKFSFGIPEGIYYGWFEGVVLQGDAEDPTYEERFSGVISDLIIAGPMVCSPDPVPQGEEVTCVVEEMAAGEEFLFDVRFFTFRGLFEEFFDRNEFVEEFDDEELVVPDIEGAGVADADGVGTFSFVVPTDRQVDGYFAEAWQDESFAEYIGEVVPAEDEEVVPAEDDEVVPAEDEEDEPAAPKPVERPRRVDTGAGGTAPIGVLPGVIALGGLVVAGGALVIARFGHARADERPAQSGEYRAVG
jgi:hypothetical protein